jgi:CubicO group peptidase (beta-lactamase class C family)
MKVRHLSAVVLTITILLQIFTTSRLSAQPAAAETAIEALMKEIPVAGLSVAVVRKGKVIYTRAFGYRDLETREPLRTDHIFRIASISKSFTATSMMQQIEAGRVSLQDDVSTLAGFPVRNPLYPDRVITLEMLLSHRSSINDSQGYFSLDAIDPSKNPNWKDGYNKYAPGEGYLYCNLNYNLAGAILERLSGERFDLYVKRHILDPLGLYGGYCVDSLDAGRFAQIYEYRMDSARFNPSPAAYNPRSAEIAVYERGRSTPVFSPTGGMKISAGDLARYMVMHSRMGKYRGGRIMRKNSAEEIHRVRSEKEGYGLAIETSKKILPGIELRGHTGSAYGLYSAMFWQPKEGYGFVVISNGCHPGYSDGMNTVIRRTIGILYESIIQKF